MASLAKPRVQRRKLVVQEQHPIDVEVNVSESLGNSLQHPETQRVLLLEVAKLTALNRGQLPTSVEHLEKAGLGNP
jgi:hypothetical protein